MPQPAQAFTIPGSDALDAPVPRTPVAALRPYVAFERAAHDARGPGSRRRARRAPTPLIVGALSLALLGLVGLSAPTRCMAEGDDTESILSYAFKGFGSGIAVGFAAGYLSTGPKYESEEWRKLLWGAGIGSLTGLGIGVILGVVDSAASPEQPGVGFYILRDVTYGYSLGALAGGIIGVLYWAGGGVSKDVLVGMAWGTVIGAGTGVVLGVLEGVLRRKSDDANVESQARRPTLQLGLGFTPPSEHGAPLPYPTLTAHF